MQSFFDNLSCAGNSVLGLNAFLYLFAQIAQIILGVTGSLALLMFVIGGFMWLISTGNQKMVEMGRATLVNALIGLLVILGSWLLIDFIMTQFTTRGSAWHTFGGKLCEEGRDVDLGATTTAPVAKEIYSLEDKHSQDKPLPCMAAATAEASCLAAEKNGDKGTLTETGCKPGEKQCTITNKDGIICDARYNDAKGYINTQIRQGGGCNILCGRRSSTGERLGKTPGSLCCQCINPNLVEYKNPNCGHPLGGVDDIGKETYKCCENKNPAAKVKVGPCKQGSAFFPSGTDCYCTLGQEGSPCVKGAQSGCSTTDLECIKPIDMYEKCALFDLSTWGGCAGNLVSGIVRVPSGWTADRLRDLAGRATYGLCTLKK